MTVVSRMTLAFSWLPQSSGIQGSTHPLSAALPSHVSQNSPSIVLHSQSSKSRHTRQAGVNMVEQMPMCAYGSSTHSPAQQTNAVAHAGPAPQRAPGRVVVVVLARAVVVVAAAIVVLVGRGLLPRRLTHTPRAHTVVARQSRFEVQWTMLGSSLRHAPDEAAASDGSQCSPTGQLSLEPAQSATTHLSP